MMMGNIGNIGDNPYIDIACLVSNFVISKVKKAAGALFWLRRHLQVLLPAAGPIESIWKREKRKKSLCGWYLLGKDEIYPKHIHHSDSATGINSDFRELQPVSKREEGGRALFWLREIRLLCFQCFRHGWPKRRAGLPAPLTLPHLSRGIGIISFHLKDGRE